MRKGKQQMNRSGFTISMIFQAESANYGEGYRNLTTLKKMTRGNYQEYSYISRQALRYNIIDQLSWNNTPVEAQGSGATQVVQFAPQATVQDYPEIDLFGYMKTVKQDGANTRAAVARLSNAISLEAFHGDMDYLTNMGLSKRQNLNNAIAQSEIHHSLYAYTISIDLDRVGIDGDISIPKEERAKRVNALLDTIEFLYRDIKGRRENLSPIFVIGGRYERKNPYFEHRLLLENNALNVEAIKSLLEVEDVQKNTYIGVIEGIFSNQSEIKKELTVMDVHKAFNKFKEEINEYYA